MFRHLRKRISTDRVSPATLQLERTYLNRFFNWAIAMGYLLKNPLDPIPHVPLRVISKPEISEQQRDALVAAGLGTFWPYLITLAWYTGARSSDLVALRWEDVDWVANTLKFAPRKTVKSGRTVELPLNNELKHLLRLWWDSQGQPLTGVICPEAKQIHDRATGSFQTQFKVLVTKTGLSKDTTFHCFRHTRARRMLSGDSKVDILVAADYLGICNLSTLRKYTKASTVDKQKAMGL